MSLSASTSTRRCASATLLRGFASSSSRSGRRLTNDVYAPPSEREDIVPQSQRAVGGPIDEEPRYKWEKPSIRPDIHHPAYDPDAIMDFRDKAARFPPAVAAVRYDKLRTAKEYGVPYTRLNKADKRERHPLPDVPVRLDKGKKVREKVQYQIGKVGITNERREFFLDEVALREEMEGNDWGGAELGEEVPGYETGRIVECRRSGQTTIGMILASLIISGRPRLLLLKSTGEIWPVTPADIQFVMPSSLIQPQVAAQCWSPELLDLWARGEETTGAEVENAMEPMLQARRQAVMVLRKILRESERMCGKIMSGMSSRGRVGGIEGVWEEITPENELERSSITSAEVAEKLLNPPGEEKKIFVKPNTLPAYAAHVLMMRQPEMFLSGSTVHLDGRFLVRSRAERSRLQRVVRITDKSSLEDGKVFQAFIDKAKRVVEEARKVREDAQSSEEYVQQKRDLPDWTEDEKDLISLILLRLFESRSTQSSPVEPIVTNVLRALDCFKNENLDRDLIPLLMLDLGVLPPWETTKRSEIEETVVRGMAVEGVRGADGAGELLQGNELDSLREDFTSQKVFVVDDPSASELDDGISVERILGDDAVWLHVHVADPTRYIPLNHPLATQASFRGSSFYAPEGNVPLFPLEVIMKELSLGAEVTRDDGAQGTMTFSTKLSPSGQVLDSNVRMGWIKKPRVITYQAVDKALGVESGKATKPFGTPDVQMPTRSITDVEPSDLDDLQCIQQFASAYRSHRMATAGFDAYQPNTSLSVVTKIPNTITNLFDRSQIPAGPMLYSGSPIINWTVRHSPTQYTGLPATSIIAEMMILAGRTAASWCNERNLPVPYRLSSAPTPAAMPGQIPVTLDELLAQRDPLTLTSDPYALAGASLAHNPGTVSLAPGEHWTMGFTDNNGYIRATSPLRRFDDMLVHWQIKSALAKEKNLERSLAPEISKEDMEVFIQRLAPAEKKVKKASITSRIWWEAGLFASRLRDPRPGGYIYGNDFVDITQPLSGRVAGPTVYGTTSSANTTPVFIPSLGATARLPGLGTSRVKIGEEVRVKVKQAMQWPAVITDVEIVE